MKPAPVIGGCISGLILALCVPELTRSHPPPNARLLSDAHGAITAINIQYRRDFNAPVIDTLCDLFTALPGNVAIWVVVEARADFDFLEGELELHHVPGRERLKAVITGFPITPWARDRFGAMSTGGATVLAVPPVKSALAGPRGNDERVPELLAAAMPGASCQRMPFMFEGGDLLADEDNAFIAANCLARNCPWNTDNRQGLLKQMEAGLQKRVIAIGETPEDVHDHHICMYLTPLGDKHVAVADPLMGLDVLRRNPQDTPPDVETNTLAYLPFQKVAASMEQQGFTVTHIPILLTRTPRVFASYNNAILEQIGQTKRIYMPVYGIPSLDQAATAIYRKLGWQVIPIRATKLYPHTGSLRCQIGIIQRS